MKRPERRNTGRVPTQIHLHRQSRTLAVSFDDGRHFDLSAEYLRVHSPSAEVRGHGPGQAILQVGKEAVGIERIEPVGQYALRLHFDDGHNTGLYSWDLLYDLGENADDYWQDYLDSLAAAGYQRDAGDSA
ncbi:MULTISPECIES: gamma-butyrobetaine hydroxylase-like domain-containing protein [Spiribacter]|jgi:DUF971 family protein|uniref:DUF971 domain-containing protein n=1 Tax=Spiribacter aquaticus TaxID=1935996 RepID=A0A557RMH0_9GAMM|nr:MULTISPECIES: DUF971 domain-containing protein [Spiribacter]AUB79178.1 1-(5-phosphoribosyl)-5-((5-phosphoribosylamino)methylideneamino)imidazole-4-carboxamide isomerase [Spiribacter roseus]KAF0279371.1 1-(5-phosphoribosyl)-5-((5-phosphoribosylamino)methylideneamino)imidazole-4-carboxamide isomerase [Spiribacter roseus]KAF0281443.1 1-(5-phosphoribosyl)-5-((5-phosphoribosylamino)methylideneamino)imidazole-4-carboxamide isomerase [Spiribacter roseus]KAF0283934.1 1-(5-phosphoribosyl)-5-((5-phosp